MPPIAELPFQLQRRDLSHHPSPNDFWHPSIERVPELLTKYLNHPKIEAEVHYVEVCLALRNFHDTTKQVHWCLLFTNNRWDMIPTDGKHGDRWAHIQQSNETWLVDPCSGLGANGEEFVHFLNSDELAARRLTLRTVATFSCLAPPHNWTFNNVLMFIAKNPKKEQLCCSVTGRCQGESSLVDSTHKWVLSMLMALPCFNLGSSKGRPGDRLMRAVCLIDHSMQEVSQTELQFIAAADQHEQVNAHSMF